MNRTSRKRSVRSRESPPPQPTFTADDLVNALTDSRREQPKGDGLSAEDLTVQLGWSRPKVAKALRELHMRGRLRATRVLRPATDGAMRPVPVYRIQ